MKKKKSITFQNVFPYLTVAHKKITIMLYCEKLFRVSGAFNT